MITKQLVLDWITDAVNKAAAEFAASRRAQGFGTGDDIAGSSGADLRTSIGEYHRSGQQPEQPAPTPANDAERAKQDKERESREREHTLRVNHALDKPAAQLDDTDRNILRAGIADWAKENSR